MGYWEILNTNHVYFRLNSTNTNSSLDNHLDIERCRNPRLVIIPNRVWRLIQNTSVDGDANEPRIYYKDINRLLKKISKIENDALVSFDRSEGFSSYHHLVSILKNTKIGTESLYDYYTKFLYPERVEWSKIK